MPGLWMKAVLPGRRGHWTWRRRSSRAWWPSSEAHLGARLLNRTTRRIALTEVGERYLEKVRQILLGVEESEALAGESTKVPRGHLRV